MGKSGAGMRQRVFEFYTTTPSHPHSVHSIAAHIPIAVTLPNELLDELLQYVHDTSASSHNLYNAILVCTRWTNCGAKILYEAPHLLKLQPSGRAGWGTCRHRQTQRLLLSLIRRPELARAVKELDLTVVYDRTSAVSSMRNCTRPETLELGIWRPNRAYDEADWEFTPQGMEDSKIFRQVADRRGGLYPTELDFKLRAEHEPTATGLLLSLLPDSNILPSTISTS
jgi:hypothetical protein